MARQNAAAIAVIVRCVVSILRLRLFYQIPNEHAHTRCDGVEMSTAAGKIATTLDLVCIGK